MADAVHNPPEATIEYTVFIALGISLRPNSRREFILLEVSVCPTKILMLLSPMENPDIFDLDI